MAGNPCEELSPTGGKKRKEKEKQNQILLHWGGILKVKNFLVLFFSRLEYYFYPDECANPIYYKKKKQ